MQATAISSDEDDEKDVRVKQEPVPTEVSDDGELEDDEQNVHVRQGIKLEVEESMGHGEGDAEEGEIDDLEDGEIKSDSDDEIPEIKVAQNERVEFHRLHLAKRIGR